MVWWVGVCVFGLGFLLGCLFWLYVSGAFRPSSQYRLIGIPASQPTFPQTIASMSDSLTTQGQVLQFWADIDTIQTERLAAIAQAQSLVQFETFQMDPGKRADAFADALSERAHRGVTVQVLADSYGAKNLPQSYWQRLRHAGVDVRFFNPFAKRSPLDYLRRNHRKLLVVDQQVAMMGGAGISDLWDGVDGRPDTDAWYDFEVQLRGEAVGLLTGFFWQHWVSVGGRVDLTQHAPERSIATTTAPILITPGEEPSTGDSPIRSLLQLCILAARERLWIASPYLLPDDATCDMLAAVRSRGVDVRILTMGPKSDKFYVYFTSRERYHGLLTQGIKIHEYQPSMMHGKLVLIDHHWASLGSANLDPRSFFHNDELNLCTNAPCLLEKIEAFFYQGFGRSDLIALETWKQRPWQERAIGQLGNFFYWQL